MRILVHVDDFACTFNDRALYDRIYAVMQERFVITDYGGGDITRFVGVCVEKTCEGHYRLHQKPYIEQVLERLNLSDMIIRHQTCTPYIRHQTMYHDHQKGLGKRRDLPRMKGSRGQRSASLWPPSLTRRR